jgi:hypothetical protein
MEAVPFTSRVDGGEGENPMVIGSPLIVTVTLEKLDGSLVALAYRVTVPDFGGVVGAV